MRCTLAAVVVVVVLVVVAVPETSSANIEKYACGKIRYQTDCGLFGWWSCTKFRTRWCTRFSKVNGAWSAYGGWSSYPKCSRTCGGGTQTRYQFRSCTNPRKAYGGNSCSGPSRNSQTVKCNTHRCPVNGGWTDYTRWTDYNTCTVPCGGGTQYRTRNRTCTDPVPQFGGLKCEGEGTDVEEQTCNSHHCPINGSWTDYTRWIDYNTCTVPCGGGTQYRTRNRTCTDPVPQFGGLKCEGEGTDVEEQTCNSHHCPINGGWTDYTRWTDYNTCTVPCGGGTQYRTRNRTCTDPVPQFGGLKCAGEGTDVEEQTCNSHHCPINGSWTDYTRWTDYNTCTVPCGGGTQNRTRNRTCTDPVPQFGGLKCEGEGTDVEEQTCNSHHCPIDGGWTEWAWEDVDECSVLCGGGSKDQERSRECVNPSPQYGGAQCEGAASQERNVGCGKDACRDLCPPGVPNYHAHPSNRKRFYQCSNGVAHLHKCSVGTEFHSDTDTCRHEARSTTPPTADSCPKTGIVMLQHLDCTKFYMCSNGNKYPMACPATTRYDAGKKVCVHNDGKC